MIMRIVVRINRSQTTISFDAANRINAFKGVWRTLNRYYLLYYTGTNTRGLKRPTTPSCFTVDFSIVAFTLYFIPKTYSRALIYKIIDRALFSESQNPTNIITIEIPNQYNCFWKTRFAIYFFSFQDSILKHQL